MTAQTVWERLAPPEAATPPGKSDETGGDGEEGSRWTPKLFWRRVRLLDIVAVVAWGYLLSKLLVDWDRALVGALAPDFAWVINFRILIFAAALLTLAYLGKKLFPLWLLYIALWPLLLVAWRIPWSLYKQGKWNHFVGLVHIVVGAVSGLKSGLRGLVLAVSSLFCLLLPGVWMAWLSLTLAGLFEIWLLLAALRTGVRPSRFLSSQRRLVARLKTTMLVQEDQISGLRPAIHGSRQLTRAETDQFLQMAANALLINRATYFWAYRVNEYRKSPALIAYSGLVIIWLLLGSVASFTMMNLSLYQVSASNFTVDGEASVIKFVYYSLTSLYSGETEVVTAASDLALLLKILATITGAVMVMVLLVTLFLSYRYTRDEAEARRTVADMRDAAERLEREFADEFQLTPDQALERIQEFNHGITGILLYLTRAVPNDFVGRA